MVIGIEASICRPSRDNPIQSGPFPKAPPALVFADDETSPAPSLSGLICRFFHATGSEIHQLVHQLRRTGLV
jgi:hypothetical protein